MNTPRTILPDAANSNTLSFLPREARQQLDHVGSVTLFHRGAVQKLTRHGHLTVIENLLPLRRAA